MTTTITNDDIAKTLTMMRPFYSESEMKVLTAFMDKISALENKFRTPEPDEKALAELDALIKSGNKAQKNTSASASLNRISESPELGRTDYVYTIIFNYKRNVWLSSAHINDDETVMSAEGVTEIDSFHNLMLKM